MLRNRQWWKYIFYYIYFSDFLLQCIFRSSVFWVVHSRSVKIWIPRVRRQWVDYMLMEKGFRLAYETSKLQIENRLIYNLFFVFLFFLFPSTLVFFINHRFEIWNYDITPLFSWHMFIRLLWGSKKMFFVIFFKQNRNKLLCIELLPNEILSLNLMWYN